MPIVINHAPDISLVGSVAHGAGRGEFDKWVYGENVKREAEKTQAFLSAFGTFSSMGMQGAQLMQNKKLANRQMDLQEKLGMARLNSAKTRAGQKAALDLQDWEQNRPIREQIIDEMNPVAPWQTDAVNLLNTQRREELKGVTAGSSYAGVIDQMVGQQLKGRYNQQYGMGKYTTGRSNVIGQAGQQSRHWASDRYLAQTMLPAYQSEVDNVLKWVDPSQTVNGKESLRGTYSPNGIMGHYGMPIPPEVAAQRIGHIQKKYRERWNKRRQQPQNAPGAIFEQRFLRNPHNPTQVMDLETGKLVNNFPVPGAYEKEQVDLYRAKKIQEYGDKYTTRRAKYESDYDDALAVRNEKRQDAKDRADRETASVTRQEALVDDPSALSTVHDKIAKRLESRINAIEDEFRGDLSARFGSHINPVTGRPWTRSYMGTPSHEFMEKWNQRRDKMFYSRDFGMTADEKRDPNNWRVPSEFPSLTSKFTQRRIHRDINRETTGSEPDSDLIRIRDAFYPAKKKNSIRIDPEAAAVVGMDKIDDFNAADVKGNVGVAGATSSIHYLEGAPRDIQRPYEPNLGERLLGGRGPYDDMEQGEPSAGWEEGRPLDPMGRHHDLSSGVMSGSAKSGLVEGNRSTMRRSGVGEGFSMPQEIDALRKEFPDKVTSAVANILTGTLKKKDHWIPADKSKSGRVEMIRENWSRAELNALRIVGELIESRKSKNRLFRQPAQDTQFQPGM